MIELITNYRVELIIVMTSIIGIGILFIIINFLINKNNKKQENKDYDGLNDTEITKIDAELSEEELTNQIFNLYKEVEIARSKFKLDTLKNLLTESFYIKEENALKKLKTSKQKIIATNINLQNIKILVIKKEEKKELIIAYLHVSQYDYVTDNKKNIIRGTDDAEYQIEYRLTIEKSENKSLKLANIETTGKWIKNN